MTKPQWLNIVKIVQALGITLIGVFFIFDTSSHFLLVGGLISIIASLVEWLLSYNMLKRLVMPIPLLASFLKIVVVLAIVFRGLFQDTELSLVSFIILVVAIALTLVFQIYVMVLSKRRKKDINTLDD